eukprot:scaffold11149_cov65-Phaeocystis_antarctica.AAC.3
MVATVVGLEANLNYGGATLTRARVRVLCACGCTVVTWRDHEQEWSLAREEGAWPWGMPW